jgi:tryptophan-rich sensory protein
LVLVVGGGLLIGYLTAPGAWYQQLAKPAYNPPGWVFGPVWTVLYVLIAIAGWRVWLRRPRSLESLSWWLQLAMNFLWSPVFFAAHKIEVALIVLVLLLVSILVFIVLAWRRDRLPALLFIPYAAWVAFASLLNADLYIMN